MGILQRLGIRNTTWQTPTTESMAAPILDSVMNTIDDMSVEQLWNEQPHLRTVTTFIARSVASTSLHVYQRLDDGGRKRIRSHAIADLMKQSSQYELTYDLIYGTLIDICLYDECYWVCGWSREGERFEILRLPHSQILGTEWDNGRTLTTVTISDGNTAPQQIPAKNIIRFSGYNPTSLKKGSSTVLALKDILKEQLESAAYRGQLWRNGPRLGGVITRPANTKWDARARERFRRQWQGQYSGRGSGAGGTPILEDGMEFKPIHLTAQDEQIVDVAKLSLQTVASAYHINPTMVGLLDNANYSNVKEFRRSLYGDSLGPVIKKIEDTLNMFLLPMYSRIIEEATVSNEWMVLPSDVYVEFNLEEKLRASFEEKAQVTSTAVGGPWMTRNEARAMNNLPLLEGADDLIMPLNLGKVTDENIDSKNVGEDMTQ